MDLYLICTDFDFSIEIPLPKSRSAQVARQLLRVQEEGGGLGSKFVLLKRWQRSFQN